MKPLKILSSVLLALLAFVTASQGSGIVQSAYSLIQDEGSALTRQSILNFEGSGVTCANGSGKTTCTVAGSAANYQQSFTSQTSVTLTHNLNSSTLLIQCFNSSNVFIIPDSVTLTNVNNATVVFSVAQSGFCNVNASSGSGSGGSGTEIHFGSIDPNGSPTEFSPTNMTNNTTPSPLVASSSGNFPTYDPFYCWNGASANQFWIGNGATGWVQIDLGSGNANTAATYSIQVNDIPEPNRAPQNFTLRGSNDGSSFTTVDTVTGQTAWTSAQVRTFTVDTPGSYRYYRVDVTLNNGDPSFIQIAKIRLYTSGSPFTSASSGDVYYRTTTRQFYGPFDGVSAWPTMGTLNP